MSRALPFAAFSVALFLASPLFAQNGSASVEGVVSAQGGGSALSGATVEVVGASTGVLTDEAGRYTLSGISSGTIRPASAVACGPKAKKSRHWAGTPSGFRANSS